MLKENLEIAQGIISRQLTEQFLQSRDQGAETGSPKVMATSGDEHDPVVGTAHGQMAGMKEAKVADVIGDHGSALGAGTGQDLLVGNSSEIGFGDRDRVMAAGPEFFSDPG